MTSASGSYYLLFTVLRQSVAQNETTGEEVESFTSAGNYWGKLEYLRAFEKVDYGANQAISDVRIRLKNQLGITALDRITLGSRGENYMIDGVQYDVNETILLCHSVEGWQSD